MERNRHVDEGTLHAWLDGALGPEESSRVEAHVAECAACGAKAAEARGLIAAASRILTALDDVPGGVMPRVRREHRRRLLTGWPLRAAAAIVFVALGSFAVIQRLDVTRVERREAAAPPPAAAPALPPVSASAAPPTARPVAKSLVKKFAPVLKENVPAPSSVALSRAVVSGVSAAAQSMGPPSCYVTTTPGLPARIQLGDSTVSWTRQGRDSIRIVLTDSTGAEQRIVARVNPTGLTGVVTTGDSSAVRPFAATRCP